MNKLKCSACNNNLKDTVLLQCSRCDEKYHYTCMNFSKQDYADFTKEFKESWVCPTCKSKEPKSGNTNTPVRSALASPLIPDSVAAAATFDYENVTLRPRSRGSCSCTCISADSIREIIREELDRKFNSQLNSIQLKLANLEESLASNCSQNDILTRENEAQKVSITELQKENEKLRVATQEVSNRLLVLEQLSRANNLEVQCVPENKNENVRNTIEQLGKIINCPVAESDIQYCSRIAKLNSDSPRPRSILVKFSNRNLRDSFLAAVIKYNRNNPQDKLNTSHLGIGGNKKSPVYVTEHLPPQTKSLHAAARRVAKQLQYKYVWVRDGKVFLRKSETSKYVHVRSEEVLKSLN